ncbi:MAG: SLC13 family permease [Anaerolineales bacterium]|nr:SLC13 family permease [Anaerolineales bacterium]
MTLPIAFLIVLVAGATLLLVTERLRPDLVALVLLVILGLTGLVAPAELFSGFSRPAVITIIALFIITAALEHTGATRVLSQTLSRAARGSEARAVFVVMLATALLSLVMNTIAAAAVLLPAVIGLARQADLRASRLLLPLSYGSLLGGMATLFTTANILVSAALVDNGLRGYGVLDFVPVGLPMAAAGIVFMALYGRRLLPSRGLGGREGPERPMGTLTEAYGLQQAVAAAYVKPGSAMAGLSLAEGRWGEQLGLNVVGISRGGSVNLAPAPRDQVLEGDLVLFTGATDDEGLGRFGLKLTADPSWTGHLASDQISLVEVILAPRSTFAGRSLREMHFREKYDLRVLAIWREGKTLREALAEIPLRFGDALLLQGRRSKINLLRDEPGLLVLEEVTGPLRVPGRAVLAVGLTAAAVGLAAANVLPIAEATFAAAVLMLLAGCLDMNDAYRSIEWKSVFLIAGMLPLGLALSSTGTAALLGSALVSGLGGLGPLAVAGGLYWAATLLTQVISGQVTPLVLAPIAIAAAERIGADPRGLGMAVALGCSTAFLTPIAHSANLLVMGPGGYTFKDYARAGLPLSLLLFVVMLAGLALFWGIR